MDVAYIAQVLRAVVIDASESEHPGHSLRLASQDLTIRFRLELPLQLDEVRMIIERYTRGRATLIGSVTLYDVQSVTANETKGEVHFVGRESELTLDREGLFFVTAL